MEIRFRRQVDAERVQMSRRIEEYEAQLAALREVSTKVSTNQIPASASPPRREII
jgi:flagellar capping protein FliD